MAHRRSVAVVAIAISIVAMAACREETVRIRYAPSVGAVYRYRSHIESTSVTALDDGAPTVVDDRATLTAVHEILAADGDEVDVRVEVVRSGSGARTYVMRFDRGAQLTAVESVEGIPAGALGELGLSEILPAGAAAPPERALAPGDRWRISRGLQLAGGTTPVRLTGSGRLVELGVVAGHKTATIEATFTFPVTSTEQVGDGTRTLNGTQRTELRATYDLDDGAVRRSEATTTATYALTLAPSEGAAGTRIDGTLTVELSASTERVD